MLKKSLLVTLLLSPIFMACASEPKSEPVVIHPYKTDVSMGILAPKEQRVTLENWRNGPFNRLAFQHAGELMPQADIYRGQAKPHRFERENINIDNISLTDGRGDIISVKEYLKRTYTDGFLVLKKGRIVSEQYFTGMTPTSRHLLFSVSKSITSSLVGILAGEGVIDLQKTFGHYLPELKKSSPNGADNPYADVKIQQALDMMSGVTFPYKYVYTNGPDKYDITSGWAPGRTDWTTGQFKYIEDLTKKDHQPGEVFTYKDIDTEMLGYVIEKITGKRFADLVSNKLLQPLAVERDVTLLSDGAGSSVVAAGFNFTLRDLGRWTQMIANGGRFNNQQIVPQDYLQDMLTGFKPDITSRYPSYKGQISSYRNQFWLLAGNDGAYSGIGIYGQYTYINPKQDIVIVKFSSVPDLSDSYYRKTELNAFAAIARSLGEAP